jgi:hypothetical protein
VVICHVYCAGWLAARQASSAASDVAMKTRLRRTTKVKRRKGPTAARRRGAPNDNLKRTLAECRRELKEALEQQAATAEVLGIISSTPGELTPVFEAMLAKGTRLCEAKFGHLYLYEGGALRIVASHNVPPAF